MTPDDLARTAITFRGQRTRDLAIQSASRHGGWIDVWVMEHPPIPGTNSYPTINGCPALDPDGKPIVKRLYGRVRIRWARGEA